ncbi:YeeE/YedE family protein [Pyxidicoccus fallax]|uniref:YeeE/YedE family protein n=1 Tax=Pyxidicoccus fallax TaxID=394095 RepID=A0A848LKF1_9BACT|nr:DUF6691 family protein [Pyxidicoccus fallax]NMO18199.1 YeeE/YedE family protein [Pyxidicoccus fallax]NPC78804.1 YeeE/YedE family protein [Pyxidicoccus fallax]
MKAVLMAGLAGLLFALGLGIGGMTDPAKVVGFLDVAGDWDPSLAFVMAGALGTHALLRRLILRRKQPVLAPTFPSLKQARVDGRLVGGAALFGIGWGLAGYCPGPALTLLVTGGPTVLLFIASMLAGMGAFRWWESARASGALPHARSG